ncbi:MAG: TolB protein [Pirellulaceae bacterium]|jgi:TolB protein
MNYSSTQLLCRLAIALVMSTAIADAGEPVRLTKDGTNKRDPHFVDEGKSLIYCYDEATDLVRMMQLNMDDLTSSPVFPGAGDKHHIEPEVSLDARYIAYTQCTGNLTARLVIRDKQEQKEAYVTHSGRGGTRSPTFHPKTNLVVYAFAETGPQQLWSVKPDGSDKKQLTQCQGISNWPSFTPDGNRIVFSNSRKNNYEIYSVNLDGSDEKRLTENTIMDIRPVVSPDGKRVAFVSTRDGNYEVYVMNIDGTGVLRLTNNEERDDYPCWHPNSRQVAIVSERDGEYDLYLHDVPDASVAAK